MPDGRERAVTEAGQLRADCASCFGLCCVVPAFAASADFAVDKPAGQACLNLQPDFRCGIHTRLRPSGFTGCTVYDCFGAGQQVSQVTFAGRDWRSAPGSAGQMFQVFKVMRDLHELLYYLTEALTLALPARLRDELSPALAGIEELTRADPAVLAGLDAGEQREAVNPLLLRASVHVRDGVRARKKQPDHRGADLIGARLKGADLRAANLRGAYLIGADLRRADLRWADLIGADLRGADLRGADLTDCLYLTQAQLAAAKGDERTAVPAGRTRPAHWTNGPDEAGPARPVHRKDGPDA